MDHEPSAAASSPTPWAKGLAVAQEKMAQPGYRSAMCSQTKAHEANAAARLARMAEYNDNPVRCLHCHTPIEYAAHTHQKSKFCDSSCSARYNNANRAPRERAQPLWRRNQRLVEMADKLKQVPFWALSVEFVAPDPMIAKYKVFRNDSTNTFVVALTAGDAKQQYQALHPDVTVRNVRPSKKLTEALPLAQGLCDALLFACGEIVTCSQSNKRLKARFIDDAAATAFIRSEGSPQAAAVDVETGKALTVTRHGGRIRCENVHAPTPEEVLRVAEEHAAACSRYRQSMEASRTVESWLEALGYKGDDRWFIMNRQPHQLIAIKKQPSKFTRTQANGEEESRLSRLVAVQRIDGAYLAVPEFLIRDAIASLGLFGRHVAVNVATFSRVSRPKPPAYVPKYPEVTGPELMALAQGAEHRILAVVPSALNRCARRLIECFGWIAPVPVAAALSEAATVFSSSKSSITERAAAALYLHHLIGPGGAFTRDTIADFQKVIRYYESRCERLIDSWHDLDTKMRELREVAKSLSHNKLLTDCYGKRAKRPALSNDVRVFSVSQDALQTII
ncbi:MAG: hypothetical protein ING75_15130 [Rhodocyclaceae bacterium]|nr:hypothetical protein [Rhodocyclaceae bacterium]